MVCFSAHEIDLLAQNYANELSQELDLFLLYACILIIIIIMRSGTYAQFPPSDF